jgi:hypothetical protein
MLLTVLIAGGAILGGFAGAGLWAVNRNEQRMKTEANASSTQTGQPQPQTSEAPPPKKPDLILQFSVSDPKIPVFVVSVENVGEVLADKIRYTFETSNNTAMMRLFQEGRVNKNDPLATAKESAAGFVRYDSFNNPDQWVQAGKEFEIGPISYTPAFAQALRIGDRLIGVASITCATCTHRRGYWVFYEVGVGGWYAETADGSEPKLQMLRPATEREKLEFVLDPQSLMIKQPLLEKKLF